MVDNLLKLFAADWGEGKHGGRGVRGEGKPGGIDLNNIHLCRNHSGDLQCNYTDLVSI